MTLLVLLIFGAVLLGCGTLLSPAWPSQQPRIGLLTALSLALVVGGSCLYATLFGWDTLVVDYLLFALVTTVFLGGTLSYGQLRAQRQGRELADRDQGWPGPRDLAFLTLAALVFVIPALLFPVPLDTDAQGFGYLALMLREGGDFTSLAPWHPEITYLYAPGFTAIVAYLSAQIGAGMHEAQLGVGAMLGVFAVWLAYDFGAELRDKRLGRAMALALLLGGGLFSAFPGFPLHGAARTGLRAGFLHFRPPLAARWHAGRRDRRRPGAGGAGPRPPGYDDHHRARLRALAAVVGARSARAAVLESLGVVGAGGAGAGGARHRPLVALQR